MLDQATNEFWKDLKPVTGMLKPHALTEAYIHDAPSEDLSLYMRINDTVLSRPLWIAPNENRWAEILYANKAGLVGRHYHPHEVFAYTISGKWGYLEHEWTATKGDFVYEPPGEGHTLVAFQHEDPLRVFFIVRGPLIWLDEEGNANQGFFDVHDYIAKAEAHYEQIGLGAAHVKTLMR